MFKNSDICPFPPTTSCPLPFLSLCVALFALLCRDYCSFPGLSSHRLLLLLLLVPPCRVPGTSCPLALPFCLLVSTPLDGDILIFTGCCVPSTHRSMCLFCVISLIPHDNPFSIVLNFLSEVKAQGHSATRWQSWGSNPSLFESRFHSLAKITH